MKLFVEYSMTRALDDIRVLDFGRFIACPYCGMLLADMGAEVIRVDRPGGEEDRTYGLIGENQKNVLFPSYARNKLGITLNLLKNETGQAVLRDLVPNCDVVIHNFAPQAAKLMGLTYENLSAIKPDIVVAAISCFGGQGPYSRRPGFDQIAQAMSGAMYLGGYEDKPPTRAFINPADFGTGLAAAFGVMTALRHRDRTGEGQLVDLALLRTAISFTAPQIAEAEVLGRERPFIGNRNAYLSPSDLYKCSDGYVFICCIMNSLWRRLCKVIGHEELLVDKALHNDLERYELRDRIDPLVMEWTAQRTVKEVLSAMEGAHIPCGPCYDLFEVSKDPHVRETGMLEYIDMEEPGWGPVPVSVSPLTMTKTPGRIDRRAPKVGEHNEQIYRTLLGYDEDRMAQLGAADVV